MPEIVVVMDYAKKKIKESFERGSQVIYNKIFKIFNEIWTNQMEQLLYDATLFLNHPNIIQLKRKMCQRQP